MASKQEKTIPLKLMVDKERNRVVVAEASGDFIDTLFSFLTLPLGTIIRLVSNKQQHDQPAEIGCINNLYCSVRSVQNFDAEVFWNKICQNMLLHPRNPCESLCQKLKWNVDDTGPTKYFMCRRSCGGGWDRFLLSTFEGARCCSCKKPMDKEVKLLEDQPMYKEVKGDPSEETHGVFVKKEAKYWVFDNLKVLQNSPSSFAEELVSLGYRDFDKLTETSRNVGLKEILNLLKQALTSKSPLSDIFLVNEESLGMHISSPKVGELSRDSPISLKILNLLKQALTFKTLLSDVFFSPKVGEPSCDGPISLKVIVRKCTKEILFAEAKENFVDFLFSFLTAPLGSILKLLNGNSSLGCMDILFKSVKDFDPSWFVGTSRTSLLDLGVATQFGFSKQPIKLNEQTTPTYWYGIGIKKYIDRSGAISKNSSLLKIPSSVKFFDPRSPDGKSNVGFVRRPSLFRVRDDLQVTPLTNTSNIPFMQELHVTLDDLEERVVPIGEVEALNLLGASLTSKTALTDGLSYLL